MADIQITHLSIDGVRSSLRTSVLGLVASRPTQGDRHKIWLPDFTVSNSRAASQSRCAAMFAAQSRHLVRVLAQLCANARRGQLSRPTGASSRHSA